jgi:hypothetical protein
MRRRHERTSTSAGRAAQRAGLVARKSRWRAGTIDNHGGFRLIEPRDNVCIAGERFDLTAEDVIELAPDNPDDPLEYKIIRAFLREHGRHPKHKAELQVWLHGLRAKATDYRDPMEH